MPYNPEHVASYYVALFAPRTDAYSRWVTDDRILHGTEPGWRPIRSELTAKVVLDGLTKQGPSVSCFMAAPGAVSHVFAIDFDTEDGYQQGLKVGSLMVERGIHCYVEASRRGAHLWGVVDRVLPARTLRRMLRYFVELAELPKVFDEVAGFWVHDPRIELRPGSDELPERTLGHALRMPTMPHPKTGKRYPLTYPWGPSPLDGDSLGENLIRLLTSPAEPIIEVAADYIVPVDPRHLPKSQRLPQPPRGPDEFENASASEILRDLWGVTNAAPGRAVKCPAHDDQHPSLSILRDDKRVICKAGSCFLNNNDRGRGTFELTKHAPKHA